MDKMIEDVETLNFGKRSYDVSNVSKYRKDNARRLWDTAVKSMSGDPLVDTDIFTKICDTQGLYLMRQDLSVLLRRMSFIRAIKNYIKRYLLSLRYIRKSTEKEYDAFQEWAYFNITGTKKKELEALNQIQKQELTVLKELERLNLSPEAVTELLRTLVRETAGLTNILTPSQKV